MSDPILSEILRQDEMIDARAETIAEARARERRMFFNRGKGFFSEIKKVRIKRDTNGDSRVAIIVPSIEQFERANYSHRDEVEGLGLVFIHLLEDAVRKHDWTKTEEPYRSLFYQDMVATMEGRLKFEDGKWAKYHHTDLERHHLNRHVPDDVNLVDVVEMLCDCVAAGLARSGEVRPVEIPDDVLQDAVKNTVRLLKGYAEIIDDNVSEVAPC